MFGLGTFPGPPVSHASRGGSGKFSLGAFTSPGWGDGAGLAGRSKTAGAPGLKGVGVGSESAPAWQLAVNHAIAKNNK